MTSPSRVWLVFGAHLCIATLRLGEGGGEQQIGRAANGVQGCPEFMTDVGQEIALGLAGSFGGFLCSAERRFQLFAFGNIPGKGAETDGSFHAERHDGQFDGKLTTVLVNGGDFNAAVQDRPVTLRHNNVPRP